MRKVMKNTVILFVFCVMSSQVAHAQMINYNRRNKNSGERVQQIIKPTRRQTKNEAVKVKPQEEVVQTAEVTKEPRVHNRVERLYDINRDGLLQKTEVNDFYKDVVSSVKNRGKFKVSSELLRAFDANADGQISRYEVKEIINQIN